MQIKRIIAVCAALALATSVTACGSTDTKDNTSAQTEQMQQTECGLCCVAMIMRYYKSNENM